MGKLLNWFKDRLNGEFEWQDLFSLTATINSMTGNNYFPENPLGENEMLNRDLGDYIKEIPNTLKNIDTSKSLIELMGGENIESPLINDIKDTYIEKVGGTADYIFGTDLENQLKESIYPQPNTQVPDMTDANLGTSNINWLDWVEEQQKKEWERVDKLRAEEYARQDSAYQRMAKDARKAGVNLNLMNMTPAQSTSTVQSATTPNASIVTKDLETNLKQLELFIEKEMEEDQGKKDRLTELIGSIIMAIAFKR